MSKRHNRLTLDELVRQLVLPAVIPPENKDHTIMISFAQAGTPEQDRVFELAHDRLNGTVVVRSARLRVNEHWEPWNRAPRGRTWRYEWRGTWRELNDAIAKVYSSA